MEYSSFIFLFLFMPVILGVFYLLKREAWNSFLLLVSVVFYLWGEGAFALILAGSIAGNYLFGRAVDKIDKAKFRTFVFWLAVGFNLGLLVYFKYTRFILENIGGDSANAPSHLPLGISFFTFQALSYLIDIHRKTISMDRNPLHFSLYMAFFPKLITGPITSYHNLREQILSHRSIGPDDLSEGVKRLVLGLSKKVLIADTLAVPANAIFAIPASDQTAGLAWLGILCYTLQIYFDFSGYTDMAIGIGRMLGLRLPENFNYPYVAASIKDFWRRWHISLAHWLRDYLFLPIAYLVSRKIKAPSLLGIKAENWAYFVAAFITFLLCGIWHGAAWTFFIWGAYYGVLLIIEHAGLGKKMKRKWPTTFQIIYCQLLVMIGWVIFRSPDMGYALDFIKAMAGLGSGNHLTYYPALYMNIRLFTAMIIGILGAMPVAPAIKKWLDAKSENTSISTASAILYNLLLALLLLASAMTMAAGTFKPFIYFRF